MDDLVQESLRPIGARGPEECFRLSFFHNASSIHEDDPIGDLAGEAHFIGDTPCSVLSLARSARSASALAATSSLVRTSSMVSMSLPPVSAAAVTCVSMMNA